MVLRVELVISQPANSAWKRRTSSAVAVSGEWPSQAANRRQLRIWAICVLGLNLRADMSSIMRACNGLMERLTTLLMGELLF